MLGDDRPLLSDWVSPKELALLVSSTMKTSPAVQKVDERFVRAGRSLLIGLQSGKISNTGQEDLVYSLGKLINEWRNFARSEKNITAADVDTWLGRAIGWEQLLAGRGVSVSGENNRRTTMRDYKGNDEELDLEIEEAVKAVAMGMDLPPGSNVTSLEQSQSCPPELFDYGVENMRRYCVNVPKPGMLPVEAPLPYDAYGPYSPYFSPPGIGPVAPSFPFNPMVTSYRPATANDYARRRPRRSRFRGWDRFAGNDDGVMQILDDRRGGNAHHWRSEEERELLADELHNAGVNVLEQLQSTSGWNPFRGLKLLNPFHKSKKPVVQTIQQAQVQPQGSWRGLHLNLNAPPPPPPPPGSAAATLTEALKSGRFRFGQPQTPRYNFRFPTMAPPPPPPPPSSSGGTFSPFVKLGTPASTTTTRSVRGAAVAKLAARPLPSGAAAVRALVPAPQVPNLMAAVKAAKAGKAQAVLGAAGAGSVTLRGLSLTRNPDGSVVVHTVIAPTEVKTLRSVLRGVKAGGGASAVVGCACSSSGWSLSSLNPFRKKKQGPKHVTLVIHRSRGLRIPRRDRGKWSWGLKSKGSKYFLSTGAVATYGFNSIEDAEKAGRQYASKYNIIIDDVERPDSSSGDDGMRSLASSTGAFEKLGCMGIEI